MKDEYEDQCDDMTSAFFFDIYDPDKSVYMRYPWVISSKEMSDS